MSRRAQSARGFWPLRDLPVVFWLLCVLVTSVVHPFVPAPRWLMIHLLLLGAVTHAIFVWSRYFTDALLHTAPGPADRRVQNLRLLLLNAAVLAVVAGVLAAWWPVTVAGATAVTAAVAWHGVALVLQLRRALPSRFGATVRYYVAAAGLLPVGAGLGTVLARGLPDPLHGQVTLAHAVVNLLGWMGLTVLGTLVTLWPTMLRTRIAAGAETAAARALPVLLVSITVAAGGAVAGWRLVAVLGVAGYLGGLVVLARPFVAAARGKPPSSYPTWSALAGLSWLVGCLVTLAVGVGTAPSWSAAGDRFGWLVPFLVAGFGAQVLLGALSYLVPVVLGGGPGPTRAANTVLDEGGALRIVLVNAGLLVCVLPVPSVVRVLASGLVLGALATFLPLLLLAIRASRRAKRATTAALATSGPRQRRRPEGERPPGQVTGQAATGLAVVVLAVAAGVALDPTALAGTSSVVTASAGAAATGDTTTVQVQARDMRFTPASIEVPTGDRLVIVLSNTDDEDVHDLVVDSGDRSGRLAPGESVRMDLGVVGRDLAGWCSVVGHRQMGMVLQIHATGDHASADHASADDAKEAAPSAAADLDFLAEPEPGFVAHDATVPPMPAGRLHRHTFTVQDIERQVAPGVTQRLWTFNGTMPGPVLHGRVGDVFEITLVNDASIGHSIDFHAGALAPDRPMRTIAPGGSLVYRFHATRAGVWMYHCASMPMSAHIANGLFGAVVIEAKDLPPVDRSYVLVQSELYLGPQGGVVDTDKLQAEAPDAVVFNGYANQYDHQPLRARVGERVRVWVLDAGPNRSTSFHVVGTQFGTTYREGSYLLEPGSGGSQSLGLFPAQGGFVELTFPEPGRYPFLSHIMVDGERGAHGYFEVTD
ncbi:MAG TPA: multicopper oxidase domain-containing protein [Nocardioidaceae bacterium]|nr:multicopper oxidase domain-containing protein [Nocardioidaceae bacterium]